MRLSWLHRGSFTLGFLTQPSMLAAPGWPDRRAIAGILHRPATRLREQEAKRTLALTVLGLALGVFLVAQWQSPPASTADDPASRDAAIHRTIDRLETEQVQLKKQISDLRAKTTPEQQQITASRSASADLGEMLAEQRALAGTVAVDGTGVEILLDDSTVQQLLPSDDPDNYIVHEFQIRDIVNLLWGAGASAISVNGERFVNSTSVYCVGSTILINDTRTSPPYHILAIGDTAGLQKALDDGNSLRDLKTRSQVYGLVLKVVQAGPLTIPAFDGSVEMKHTDIAATTGQPG